MQDLQRTCASARSRSSVWHPGFLVRVRPAKAFFHLRQNPGRNSHCLQFIAARVVPGTGHQPVTPLTDNLAAIF
jgi:hypothetical protein